MMLLMVLLVPWAANAQGEYEVQIGEGTSTTGYFPFYTLYNYSIAENLFLASELTDAGLLPGEVTSLSWEANNAPGYEQQGISIWMANVTDEALTTTSHVTTGMTLVYTGSVTPAVGWNEFMFNEASFIWDGASNILIFCQRNNGTWNSTVNWKATTGLSFNAMAYRYQDSGAYDVTIGNTMYVSTTRPNIIFKGVASGGDCDMPTAIAVSNIGPYGATVTWEGEGSEWNLRYKAPNDEDFTLVENVTSPYTLTSLNYNTTYSVGVQTVCTGSTSFFKSTSFTTDNPCSAPTGLQASDITHESATLKWSASYPTQESWIVKYKKSADAWEDALTANAADTTLTLNDLEGNTTYNVRVYACEDEAYTQATFTTKNPCAAPTAFVASNITDNSAVISWTPGYYTQESWIVKYKTSAMAWDTAYVQNVTTTTTTLNELAENTTYNVRIYACEDGSPLNGSFTTKYGCSIPTNLMVLDITTESANVSWVPGYQETEWTFMYWKVAETPDTITQVVNAPTIALEGLEISSQYQVRVYNCLDANPLSGSFYTADECPESKVCIGTGITTNGALPSQTYYNYSLSQQIYTAAEIGTAGVILSIDFYSTATERTRNMDIYMVSTDKQTFADKDDFVSVTADDLVFSGDVTFTQNAWTTIELQNFFDYDGTSNICIVVDDNTGSYKSGSNFYVFNAYANQSLYVYSDGTNYDPMEPAFTNMSTIKNRVRLYVAEPTTCDQPTDLAVDYTVGSTEATLSWTENGTATAWQICINDDEEHLIDVTTNPYTLTGLTLETVYSVKVRANCGDDQSFWSNSVSFECTAKFTIGDGSTTNSYLPTYIYYLNSLTQQIYTAAELGDASVIESIDFNCTQNNSYPRAFDIYMVSTDKSAFERTTDWITVTESDLVYSGTVTLAQGWNTFVLDDPFVYDGMSNVAIIVDATASSYQSGPAFYAYPATAQALRVYSDGTNYDPFNPTQYTGTIESSKNQIRIVKSPYPTCWKPLHLSVSDILNHSAVLSWTNGDEEEAWQICFNGDEEHLIDVTESPYTFTGLTPETTYTVKMRSVCSEDDQSIWTREISFTTDVPCPAPTEVSVKPYLNTADVTWNGVAEAYDIEWAETTIPSTADALWLRYDNDTVATYVGSSSAGTWTWGVMYPASMLEGYTYLNKVGVYEESYYYSMESYTVDIYAGGEAAPDSLIATEIVYPMGTSGMHEITLATPVTIDPTQNLWITVTAYGTYVLTACETTEPNNQWVDGGDAWYNIGDLASSLAGYGWMIRGFIDTVPAALTWNSDSGVTSPYTIAGLEAETEYYVRVKALCGGEDGESEWTTVAFTTHSACDAAEDLTATEVQSNFAILDWTGYQSSYNLRYGTFEVNDLSSFTQIGSDYTAADTLVTYTIDLSAYSGQGAIAIRHYNVTDMFRLNVDDIVVTNAGGDVVYSEDFESGEFPTNLVNIDNDGDGFDWDMWNITQVDGNGNPVGNGEYCATSASYNSYGALTPDNWLVIPDVEMGGTLTFVARGQDPEWSDEVFGVYVTTEANWHIPAQTWVVENVTNPYRLTGLTPLTQYEWQVQGINAECDSTGMTAWSNVATFTTTEFNTQTIALTEGWNWISANVEITLANLQNALVATGYTTGLKIKSKGQNTAYQGNKWRGSLTSMDVALMYKVYINTACEITLEGTPIDPADHPITINNGTNWIGFPFDHDMTPTEAFAGFAVNGDKVRSKGASSNYTGNRWRGNVTLEPGQGYIYTSNVSGERTLVYPTGTRTAATAVKTTVQKPTMTVTGTARSSMNTTEFIRNKK